MSYGDHMEAIVDCVLSYQSFVHGINLFGRRHPATVTVIEIVAVIGIVVWGAGYRLIRVRK